MRRSGQLERAKGSAIGRVLVREPLVWRHALPLQQLAHELADRLHVVLGLDQHVRAPRLLHPRPARDISGCRQFGPPISSRCQMWTAPCSQDDVVGLGDLIACAHMSGLLARSHMSAGQGGFRDVRPKHWCDHDSATGTCGFAHVSGSTDHATCSSSCKVRHQLDTDAGLSCPVPGPISMRPPRLWTTVSRRKPRP